MSIYSGVGIGHPPPPRQIWRKNYTKLQIFYRVSKECWGSRKKVSFFKTVPLSGMGVKGRPLRKRPLKIKKIKFLQLP